MLQKILSLLLSALAVFFTSLPTAVGRLTGAKDDAPETFSSVREYMDYIQENGVPSMSTDRFLAALKPVDALRRFATGRGASAESERFIALSMDETLSGLCGYIMEHTGLDIETLLGHLPAFSGGPAVLLSDSLHLDTAAIRADVFAQADAARAEGHTLLATLLYAFSIYFGAAEDIKIYTVDSASCPGEKDVLMDVTYHDGKTETVSPDITIDPVSGHAHHPNGESGVMGTGFDVDIFDLLLYTTVNCWQRQYGFAVAYDLFSYTSPLFNYLTRRFVFSYGGKEWMIQIWKGNYGMITNGAELGLYTREAGNAGAFFQSASDDEMLPMGITLMKGEDVILTKSMPETWWVSAFRISPALYLPDTLTLKFSVTLPDAEMLSAFTAAMDAAPAADVTYTVDGLTVNGSW